MLHVSVIYTDQTQCVEFFVRRMEEKLGKVLFVNNEVGAIDLNMDPTNSRILFASMWRAKRTPYSLESGGEGSGLWKSIDGGTTRKNISTNKGIPKGTIGIIGVSVSKSRSAQGLCYH